MDFRSLFFNPSHIFSFVPMLKSFHIYQSVARGSQMKYMHLKNSLWRDLTRSDTFWISFHRRQILTQISVYSVVEGGTWVVKVLYQKHWFLRLFSFMRAVLNSDLEQKNASSNCDLWEVSLHITEELWITAFLMNVTSLNPSDLQNSQMF